MYHFRTHGCVRLHPDAAASLFSHVEVGTPGEIIYEPVLMARLDDGRIFVEADPDAYGLQPYGLDQFEALAESGGLSHMIDWRRVRQALERRDGLARDVSVGRISWCEVMPLELGGLGLLLSGEENLIAGNCSNSER